MQIVYLTARPSSPVPKLSALVLQRQDGGCVRKGPKSPLQSGFVPVLIAGKGDDCRHFQCKPDACHRPFDKGFKRRCILTNYSEGADYLKNPDMVALTLGRIVCAKVSLGRAVTVDGLRDRLAQIGQGTSDYFPEGVSPEMALAALSFLQRQQSEAA